MLERVNAAFTRMNANNVVAGNEFFHDALNVDEEIYPTMDQVMYRFLEEDIERNKQEIAGLKSQLARSTARPNTVFCRAPLCEWQGDEDAYRKHEE